MASSYGRERGSRTGRKEERIKGWLVGEPRRFDVVNRDVSSFPSLKNGCGEREREREREREKMRGSKLGNRGEKGK